MIGKTISHYRILEKLGEGGMGVVYKAHDTTLDRDVALKFLSPHLTSDPTEKERFYHEARAAAALTHQNIAVVYEIGEHEGQLFIAMEFVEGTTLKKLVGSETLSVRKLLDIAIQVGEGLAVAHEKGIVHRDIKSENIIITPKGQAKIMDFGLAKVRGMTRLTQAGSTPGTAAYMSPEQAQGEDIDHRSDIFSFGVVLYELLTGKLPFKGEHEAALMYSIINQEPSPLARFNEKAGDDLQRIVSKALAKDREERYQHVDEMMADFRRERSALESARTGRMEASTVQSPARIAGEPTVAKTSRRSYRRYLIPAAIVGAAVVLILLFNPFSIQLSQKKTAAADRKSVAVLPFENMSDSKEDEFFSDGITEDIITQLSNIGELKVISRTSVMQYKHTTKNLRDIARELNVATVLEGSVRRAGNQVRIGAQLIDATNDEHIWAQTYDKEITQIFAIQSDVAQQIALALKAKLSPREKEQIAKKPTDNLDAYAYYLKGREYYYRYTTQDNESAIDFFKKALSLDPNYALAYAGLGDAYGQSRWAGAADSSIAASRKAISIDPNLAEGYKALGLAYAQKGWIRKSLEAYEKAIEINPNYSPALGNLGTDNQWLGRFDEALSWHKRAVASNPMFAYHYAGVGAAYAALGDDAKAIEWCDKAIALQPDVAATRAELSWTYLRRREYQQAIDEVRKALSRQPDDVDCLVLAGITELLMNNYAEAERYFEKGIAIDSMYAANTQLGYVYWKTERKDQARKLFARSLRLDREQLDWGSEHWGVPYDMACVNAIQGNKAEAYTWLQKAIDAGWRDYRYAEIDPFLENLRGNDRFKQMMAGVSAQVREMRKRVEEAEAKEATSGSKH